MSEVTDYREVTIEILSGVKETFLSDEILEKAATDKNAREYASFLLENTKMVIGVAQVYATLHQAEMIREQTEALRTRTRPAGLGPL